MIEVKPSESPLHFYGLSSAHQLVTELLPYLKLPLAWNDILIWRAKLEVAGVVALPVEGRYSLIQPQIK